MTFKQLRTAIYAALLTNYYGFKFKKNSTSEDKKNIRIKYAQTLLSKLNIRINIIQDQKLPQEGQYLLVCNHRSIIDPLIIELVTKETKLFGYWVSKKELSRSFFFGNFVRKSGAILLDRDSSSMGDFFLDIKDCVKGGNSIYIFPEGTRNKGDGELGEFKEGSRIIAMKNRLPILPVFIKTQANGTLMDAIKYAGVEHVIDVEVGDIIDYKDRSISLDEAYKKQFGIQ